MTKAEKNVYDRAYYQNNKGRQQLLKALWHGERFDWLRVYKQSRGCVRCGYDRVASALDLHHRDPSRKLYDASALHLVSKNKLLAEVKKCDVLCSNCHRELHAEAI